MYVSIQCSHSTVRWRRTSETPPWLRLEALGSHHYLYCAAALHEYSRGPAKKQRDLIRAQPWSGCEVGLFLACCSRSLGGERPGSPMNHSAKNAILNSLTQRRSGMPRRCGAGAVKEGWAQQKRHWKRRCSVLSSMRENQRVSSQGTTKDGRRWTERGSHDGREGLPSVMWRPIDRDSQKSDFPDDRLS